MGPERPDLGPIDDRDAAGSRDPTPGASASAPVVDGDGPASTHRSGADARGGSTWTPPPIGARATLARQFGIADVEAFARLSGDRNPIHLDARFAHRTRFGRPVVQGGLTTGLFNAIVAMDLPGPGSVFLHQEWQFTAPVYVGDTVTALVEVIAARVDKPITTLRCLARRGDGTVVLQGTSVVYTLLPVAP